MVKMKKNYLVNIYTKEGEYIWANANEVIVSKVTVKIENHDRCYFETITDIKAGELNYYNPVFFSNEWIKKNSWKMYKRLKPKL